MHWLRRVRGILQAWPTWVAIYMEPAKWPWAYLKWVPRLLRSMIRTIHPVTFYAWTVPEQQNMNISFLHLTLHLESPRSQCLRRHSICQIQTKAIKNTNLIIVYWGINHFTGWCNSRIIKAMPTTLLLLLPISLTLVSFRIIVPVAVLVIATMPTIQPRFRPQGS